jgi:hypothetical protein
LCIVKQQHILRKKPCPGLLVLRQIKEEAVRYYGKEVRDKLALLAGWEVPDARM